MSGMSSHHFLQYFLIAIFFISACGEPGKPFKPPAIVHDSDLNDQADVQIPELQWNAVAISQQDQILANPYRGLYLPLDTEAAIEQGNYQLRLPNGQLREVGLIRYILDLSEYCNSHNISLAVSRFGTTMTILKEANKQAIFRIIYSGLQGESNACGHFYPASLNILQEHLEQLAPAILRHQEQIAFIEAGVIGPWGEWHQYGRDQIINHEILEKRENRQQVVDLLLEYTADLHILLRRPVFKLEYLDSKPSRPQGIDRLGFHNDCFLTSKSPVEIDAYTYSGDYNAYNYGYTDPMQLWEYTAEQTKTVPIGGETCRQPVTRFSCSTSLDEMRQQHWTYINGGFYAEAIESWINGGCFETVEEKLGYQFHVKSFQYFLDQSTQKLHVTYEISNTGFANYYKAHEMSVQLYGTQGIVRPKRLSSRLTAMNNWNVDSVTRVHEEFSLDGLQGDYELVLGLDHPGAVPVKLHGMIGNQQLWDQTLRVNRLYQSIQF